MLPFWVDISVSTFNFMVLFSNLSAIFAISLGGFGGMQQSNDKFIILVLGAFFVCLGYVFITYWQWKKGRAPKHNAS